MQTRRSAIKPNTNDTQKQLGATLLVILLVGPFQACRSETTTTSPSPSPERDAETLCAIAIEVEHDDQYGADWKARAVFMLFDESPASEPILEAMRVVAMAPASESRYELMVRAFEEEGIPGWTCPALRRVWSSPTPDSSID